MYATTVTIGTPERACQFVQACSRMDFKIELESGDYIIDAKSLMGLFSLDLARPIQLRAGCDARQQGLLEQQIAPYMVH